MKFLKSYIVAAGLLFCMPAFTQVRIDHSIVLTGTGNNARISGIDSVTNSQDAVSVKTLQNGGFIYAMATGSNNNLYVSLNPPITAYQTGMMVNFISNQSVGGSATLNVNNLGPVPITKYISQSLSGCEIQNKQVVTVVYDGTNFQMTSVITPGTPAGTPVATAGTAANTTQITANWDSATNTTGYYLDVATDSGFLNPVSNFSNLNVGDVFTYNITGLSCGTTYYYRVRASNPCGQSANSNVISDSTLPVAGVPVAIAASGATGSQVTANWNVASNATGYYLDVATDTGFTNLVGGYDNLSVGNVTSYLVSGLSCGNTYYYRVRATNGCGTSGNSNIISTSVSQPYLPITLTNSSSSGTGTNFQQMITVNSSTYSSYENSGLQNVEFTTGAYGTGTVLQAWIESGASNSSTNTVYWVNLGSSSISGNSTLTIYMNFMSSNVMSASGPTGEAPQLSGSYGQYDNGPGVFSFYDNFAGSSLNGSKWSNIYNASFSLNNGLTYNGDGGNEIGQTFAQSTSSFSTPVISDGYIYPTNSGWLGWSMPNTYSNGGVLFYYVPSQGGWSTYCGGSQQLTSGTNDAQNNWYIMSGLVLAGGQTQLNVNYSNVISSGGNYFQNTSGSLYLANGGGTGLLQWIRVRNYPPTGSMPAGSFGSLGCL